MRSTYPDYFEKQKTTDTLPYSTREVHFANYTNKLKLQIGATHTSRYRSVYFWSTVPKKLKSLLCIELISKSEWLKTTILQNNWSQRTYPAWTHTVSQTVNILLHWMSVALATVRAVASGDPVMPGPPFEIGAPPFNVWPPGCCIHPILYF